MGEGKDKQKCPCGKAIESRTHIVAECGLYQEERDVLEGEMRDLDKSGMKSFDALHSREKTIAMIAAATRWCRGPTSASRWKKRGFDSSRVGIFSS